tara:strand:+ start:3875 stop:4228 length:354 start_codon:yes stop_codon:yes gene_type:complete
MNKIEMGKQYRDSNGGNIEILSTSKNGPYPVVAMINGDSICVYAADGRFFRGKTNDNDLIEVGRYDDFKEDDPVKNVSGGRYHFSHVDSAGTPFMFAQGKTSWTTSSKIYVGDVTKC